ENRRHLLQGRRAVAVVAMEGIAGPDQTYAQPVMRAEPILPRAQARLRKRRKIATWSGNGLEPRLERERQSSQRPVKIERGKFNVRQLRQAERNALHARQQRMQGRLDLEDEPRAELRHHRGVTRILNRIAEPFIAVQQDGLARDRLLAEPARL